MRVVHFEGRDGIKTGRRFVEENDLRVVQQCPGQSHSLAKTLGETAREVARPRREV